MGKSNNIVDFLYQGLQKIIRSLLFILSTALVIIVFCNVIGRYFFHAAISWSEEIARFLFLWTVFMGAVIAYVNNEHLGLDILVKSVPKKVQFVLQIVADILVMFAIGLITKGGMIMTIEGLVWRSPAVNIPYGYIYIIVPICGTIMILQTLLKMAVHLKGWSSDTKISTSLSDGRKV